MAASFDAKRFGGPIGQILLADQERVLAAFLGDVSGRRMLDMATGTGRAALALAQPGRTRHRRRCLARNVERRAHARSRRRARRSSSRKAMRTRWPFPDRAFDAVVCLRMLMHVPDWRKALSELCRVSAQPARLRLSGARQRRRAPGGVAQGGARLRAACRGVSRVPPRRHRARARTPRLSNHRRPQTVRPADRASQSRRVGGLHARLEGMLAGVGMLRLAGSPVTIAAERCAS